MKVLRFSLKNRFSLLVLLLLCVVGAKAQGDLSGVYFIANPNNGGYNPTNHGNNWYLVPASNQGGTDVPLQAWAYNNNPETPYLTTYKTNQDDNSLWEIIKVEGENYYYIKHVSTGKYVVSNPASNNGQCTAFHLEAVTNPGTDAQYEIAFSDGSAAPYYIRPRNLTTETYCFANPWGGNKDTYYGQNSLNGQNYEAGLLGLWVRNDVGSTWYLEAIDLGVPEPPIISYDYVTGKVSIVPQSSAGVTLFYTTDDTTPTTSSTQYNGPFPRITPCTVNAIAVRSGQVSEVASYDLQRVARPTMYADGDHIVFSCATAGATILYTIDGSDPDPANVGGDNPTQEYTASTSFGYEMSGVTIKAIAVKDGMIVSQVNERAVKLRCPTPAITINYFNGEVTINCRDTEAAVYYTTDGSTPTVSSTLYTGDEGTGPFVITEATTLKAFAVHTNYYNSFEGSATFNKVLTPEISMNNLHVVTLTCATNGASIYYTTDGSTPDPANAGGSNPTQLYTGQFNNEEGGPVKAIAVKRNMVPSDLAESQTFKCAKPIITHFIEGGDHKFRITAGNFPAGVEFTFYYTYTTDGSTPPDPTEESLVYTGPVDIDVSQENSIVIVKAIAVATGYLNSDVSIKAMTGDLEGTGEDENDPYLIATDGDFDLFVILCNSSNEHAYYKLIADVSAAGSERITVPFTGFLVGSYVEETGVYHKISDLDHPLFNTLNGATVKDIMLDNVNITNGDSNGDVGAFACYAEGNTRIYNCGVLASISSTVSGSRDVGGIVGWLEGNARVVNCFSFADITGGSYKGGIVGYNGVATTANNLTAGTGTIVMNCMFYGDIAAGGNVYPVYGGKKITNRSNINNYNYSRFESPYQDYITEYNCAQSAEEKYLTRFEFHRLMLNSNRDLAAYYVDPSPTTFTDGGGDVITRYNKDLIAKWVLDKSIAPYPVLKAPSTAEHVRVYPSVVNYDPEMIFNPETGEMEDRPDANASDYQRNQGGIFGTLAVTIQDPAGSGKPEGAGLTQTSLSLNIIDKDTANFSFNYYKVQLPYYNSVGTGNYTKNKVVTGWKIVSVETDGSVTSYNSFTTGVDAPAYNFADRYCTDKDLYSVTGRVFSQGAYYDVPEGVTAITIEPYWGNAVYLSDPRFDKTFNNNYGAGDFGPAGKRFTNGQTYSINGDDQVVYTSTNTAFAALNSDASKTVYDYAVVLVGNYHQYYGGNSFTGDNQKPVTVMSADLDFDNEPDFSFVYQHGNPRVKVSPLRFDFINFPGIGMMQKVDGTIRNPELGIFWCRGWFEITNTCVIRFNQMEYDDYKALDAPLILLGGCIEQIVSKQDAQSGNKYSTYLHLGSNVWFKEFANGGHGDRDKKTPHRPISVTGGDYDKFYLSGVFRPNNPYDAENAECYINGGRFGEVAGAGMEKIDGDVTWLIDHADIEEFYGGGINAANNISGDIDITINNSYVQLYCAGPKFGDMETGKSVSTEATGSIFGRYYGAGYGGTSYSRVRTHQNNNILNTGAENINNESTWWNNWVNADYDRQYHNEPSSGKVGISTNYEYEYFQFSGGGSDKFVGRFYVNYASLSLSTTHTVHSVLNNCEVMTDYYGGGCLGYVDGDAYSTLTDCTIHGNVYGGGFSAEYPTLKVMDKAPFTTVPHYNQRTGIFEPAVFPNAETYTWHQVENVSAGNEFDEANHYILTTKDMTKLGEVRGSTFVTVQGNTQIEGMLDGEPAGGVFGAGNASSVLCNATVVINTNNEDEQYAINNVYGGGNVAITGNANAAVGENNGNTFVTIEQGLIGKMVNGTVLEGTGSVFGGGKGSPDDKHYGDVLGNTTVTLKDGGFVRRNLYGGCKLSNVGRTRVGTSQDGEQYVDIDIPVDGTGHTIINIEGGEVGYPRTIEEIEDNPHICHIFGAGMGDPDVTYNTWTNVNSSEINLMGGHVWGSVYGGGEEGHVLGDVTINIGGDALVGNGLADDDADGIGGTSGSDGNVFGGGRGMRALALTAGGIGGNSEVNINGNAIVFGSVYGGGRMGSVGSFFCVTDHPSYGLLQPGDNHGYITVNIGGNARIGTEHKNNPLTGHVMGGCKGAVFFEGISPNWPYLGRAKGATVTIKDEATVYGDVYGGSEDGSILENTEVNIQDDAVIGSTDPTKATHQDKAGESHYPQFGSVFGGGRGYSGDGFDDDTNMDNEPVAKIAGRVLGNSTVNMTGGHVLYGVFGGGNIATVGQVDEDGRIVEGTGLAAVNISGGEVGPLDWSGMNAYVYGGVKGVEDDEDNLFKNFCNVNNTVVNISNADPEIPTIIAGSVFGGGSDGHVFADSEVNIDGDKDNLTIGTTGTTTWDGNIFGGGRNYLHSNLAAGRVGGNTSVTINDGTILGSVYGGGRLGSVGVDENGTMLEGTDHGYTTVTVSGGVIGNEDDGFIGGNVYGGCKGYVAANPELDQLDVQLANVKETEVLIQGNALVKGSAFAGGEDGHVFGNTMITVQGDAVIGVKLDNPLKGNVYGGGRGLSVDQNGNYNLTAGKVNGHSRVFINGGQIGNSVFGGGNKSVVDEERVVVVNDGLIKGNVFGGCNAVATTEPLQSFKTVNIRGGHINGNVYGCSNNAIEGNTQSDPTAFVNITGGIIDKNVHGAGYTGTVNGSAIVNIGTNAIYREGRSAESRNAANVFFNVGDVPQPAKLIIGGSVYCGSDHYGSDAQQEQWNSFDITGYGITFVDGEGYDTENDEDNATLPYMSIAGGLYGSGTHCESGAMGRSIVVRNYGHRTVTSNEVTSATRTLTTIQRCGYVALDNVNIQLTGASDISKQADGNYAVLKVDDNMYVGNASSLVLGEAEAPAQMDSIHAMFSSYLTSGTIYDQDVLSDLPWDWIAIKGNTAESAQLYHHNDLDHALTRDQENVILFNGDSRLWVRYGEGNTTKYGELNGFFRMRADNFEPYGVESFAYARPKLTVNNVMGLSQADELNKGDGGFLSYLSDYNFHTQTSDGYPYDNNDGGLDYTKTKQYPYTNVIESSRAVNCEYRLWAIPKLEGAGWYVDGREESDGIGVDDMAEGRGLFPDKPKKTISATNGIYDGATLNSAPVTFNQEDDIIYVVGHVNSKLETGFTDAKNLNREGDKPLKLFRYPGGHELSSESATDPGANYKDMLLAESNYELTLNNVQIDGLFGLSGFDHDYYSIPFDYDASNVTEPLVVTKSDAELTLNAGTKLMRGYNNTDGKVWFTDSDYEPVENVHHGGALYVDPDATVNVEGMLTITGNQQNNDGTPIVSNVYLSSFAKSLTITNALAAGTEIGITSPIRNDEDNYTANTFSPVGIATDAANAQAAWNNNNFYDDLNWFFYKAADDHSARQTYYATTIPDYSGDCTPANTVFFGWTWANVVRTAPTDFAYSNIDSAEDLAWLISVVNGLNGQTANTLSEAGTIKQTADVDMQKYVWVPIGAEKSTTAVFSGKYDGQGHIIENLDIDYIGSGDLRYEYTDYGLFGTAVDNTIDRTFVVSGLFRPVGTANMGGLVGRMQGQSALISNSEAAVQMVCPMSSADLATGGLVGKMRGGDIHSSMAMPHITIDQYNVVGGLVGSSEPYTASGTSKTPTVQNSFANAKFTIENNGANVTYGAGGLVGLGTSLVMKNCYVNLYDNATSLPVFSLFVAHREDAVTINQSYAFGGGSYSYCSPDITLSDCGKFTPVKEADYLGYMYDDNTVTIGGEKSTLYDQLNGWVKTNNGRSNTYSYWSRPGLAEINGDLPVLQLCNGATGLEGNGDFRSLATYQNGAALQYGGEVRDGNGHQLSDMLGRAESIYVYGDVTEDLSNATVAAVKVSLNEHAAILHPGALGDDFTNTYVGITFDNSFGHATYTPEVNYGLNGMGMGPYLLPRDWHMFSSPLKDAPLGFNYQGDNVSNSTHVNNPWTSYSSEFSWLNGARYWMKGWTNSLSQRDNPESFDANAWVDGYFPSKAEEFGTGLIEGTDEEGRYPYGMDFFTWNEPQYHWINLKRNGPNHWHSDEPHVHLDYVPVSGATANQNEEELIVGRGYMASITTETFLQSHGTLNADDQSIMLTKNGKYLTGWNLVGNPYHGYLDFDLVAANTQNANVLSKKNDHPFYVIYDADEYDNDSGDAGSAFRYYPATCSKGGDYADRYLHPHQGFYVKTETGGTLNFTEDMLATRKMMADNEEESHFRNIQPRYPLVNLYLSSEKGCADITVIEFERPDWGGACKLKELRVGDGLFYAQHGDRHYAALFAKAGTERVPLWFEAKDDDVFTIKWNTANGDFQSMYLVDNMTGIQYDMIAHDSYTFEGHVGDYPSRFYIIFSVTDVEEHEDDSNHSFAFFDGTQWLVTGDGVLDFIDLNGRVLSQVRVNGQQRLSLPDVASGVYLFRLTNGKETKVQKVIVTK